MNVIVALSSPVWGRNGKTAPSCSRPLEALPSDSRVVARLLWMGRKLRLCADQ
jgi:hypothetical protein